jgi:mRNA interferase MazF
VKVGSVSMLVNQGDIYWVRLEDPGDLEPGIPHPHVVVQDDVFNHSRLSTVVACALTSNIARVSIPGNVLLEAGEGNLPRQSVVEVSKVSAVEKTRLGDYIGSLSEQRVKQILAAMRFLQTSFFTHE